MSTKQNKIMGNIQGRLVRQWLLLFLLALQSFSASANDVAITNLEFSSLGGNKLQVLLEMSGDVVEPKIFQTDNPSRIALDFEGVKSNLAKKSFPINQGAANTVYVVEASGRTRVVINLAEKVPYETRVDGNKYYVILKSAGAVAAVNNLVKTSAAKDTSLSQFLPEQGIKSIDFRRGPNGEGRLLLGLTTPNTVVDAKQSAGKVVLTFLNTKVPESLIKSFDVSDFATPVQKIDVVPRGKRTTITITPNNPNFDYSSYQADNVLTVEFRPLTPAEKEAQLREKQPYIGSKLSLNFQEIDVKSVLMILADHIKTQEGKEVNIITTDSVAGSIALHVNDVPWDQVLDVVMKLRGLSKRENGNVILIGPIEEIKDIEEKELEARKIKEELEPLITEHMQINYAKAENICNILLGRSVTARMAGSALSGKGGGASGGRAGGCGTTIGGAGSAQAIPAAVGASPGAAEGMRLLSPRGSVIADSRTNVLIVKDTAEKLEEAHKMIAKLDIPVRQVMIEARVVIATTNFARDLGVKFGVNSNTNTLQPDNGAQMLADLGYTLASSTPQGALAMTLASGANYLLSMEIQALQNEGRGEQLSNPRVLTSDRQLAHIEQGTAIPYTVAQSATSPATTTYVDATLSMDVTPQITPTGSIIMDIFVSKDAPGVNYAQSQGGEAPSIEKKNVETRVQVEDGETIVLGGVYESNYSKTKQSVPWFGELPLFGWLFTPQDNLTDNKTELLIFVTPKVVKDSRAANY